MTKMQDAPQTFVEAMQAAGLSFNGEIIPDGQPHRFSTNGKPDDDAGWYVYFDDGDFQGGAFGNWRTGDKGKWHSKMGTRMSAAEKQAASKKMQQARAALKQERERRSEEARSKAKYIWEHADADPAKIARHGYVVRKKIKPHNVKLWKEGLAVPMYDGKRMVSLQFISPVGEKNFITGTAKKGSYAIAGVGPDDQPIVVSEGYATAASIHMATGYTSIAAFDSGNLPEAVGVLIRRYPDRAIVVAGDNDQWNRTNAGLAAVKKCVGLYEGRVKVCYPQPQPDHPDRPTDFNDIHCSDGLEKVKATILAVAHNDTRISIEPNAEIDPLFYKDIGGFKYNADGELLKTSVENLRLAVEHMPPLKGLFGYDTFARKVTIVRRPPWENAQVFEARNLDDMDIYQVRCMVEAVTGVKGGTTDTLLAIEASSRLYPFNPPRDHITGLRWDRVPRLHTWLREYMGCRHQSDEYLSLVGTRMMVAHVGRIIRPGLKFDTIVVFEGGQGSGKSTAARHLGTIGGKQYFTDSIGFTKLDDKESVMQMQECAVIELAEMKGLAKREVDEVKQWISKVEDTYTPKYRNHTLVCPRQFIAIGTTNNLDGYLRDETGNRRFWPVRCGRVKLDALAKDLDQLRAEATHLFANGEPVHLKTQTEIELVERQQIERREIDPWEDEIHWYCKGMFEVTVEQIMAEALKLDTQQRNEQASRRVRRVLLALGYETTTRWDSNSKRSTRVWRRGDWKSPDPTDAELDPFP